MNSIQSILPLCHRSHSYRAWRCQKWHCRSSKGSLLHIKVVAQHDFVSANLNRVRVLEGNKGWSEDTINDNCLIRHSWGIDTIVFHHFNLRNSGWLGQGFISSIENKCVTNLDLAATQVQGPSCQPKTPIVWLSSQEDLAMLETSLDDQMNLKEETWLGFVMMKEALDWSVPSISSKNLVANLQVLHESSTLVLHLDCRFFGEAHNSIKTDANVQPTLTTRVRRKECQGKDPNHSQCRILHLTCHSFLSLFHFSAVY